MLPCHWSFTVSDIWIIMWLTICMWLAINLWYCCNKPNQIFPGLTVTHWYIHLLVHSFNTYLYKVNYMQNFVNLKSVQFSSVAQLCPTLWHPMNCSMPGLPVHHQLLELAQTHVHWVGDAIQQSHPLSFPSPPAFNLSQHQGLFKWVSSSHQVAKVLEF